jgi:hypothetical protein
MIETGMKRISWRLVQITWWSEEEVGIFPSWRVVLSCIILDFLVLGMLA